MSFTFVTGFVANIQAPPLLLGLRALLYQPNQCETIAMGDCYILCGWSSFPGPLGRRIVGDACRSCCHTLQLEGGIIDLCLLLAPDAVVTGVLAFGHETVFFVYLGLGALVLSLRLFFVKNLLSSWWTGVDVELALALARLLLQGYCPLVPHTFPPVLCGGGAGPGVTRSCSPGHIAASDLETGPWAVLPRPSPAIRRLPMGWPGLGVRVCLHIFETLSVLFPGNIGLHFLGVSRSFFDNV